MAQQCGFSACDEPQNASVKCRSCGGVYCKRHVADGDYEAYLRTVLTQAHSDGRGTCINCIRDKAPTHVLGTIDRRCSFASECLARLPDLTTKKRLCGYCGRWFCSTHFILKGDLTVDATERMRNGRIAAIGPLAEGACGDCLRKDTKGADLFRAFRTQGILESKTASVARTLEELVLMRLPEVAGETSRRAAEEVHGATLLTIKALEGSVAGVMRDLRGTLDGVVETMNRLVREVPNIAEQASQRATASAVREVETNLGLLAARASQEAARAALNEVVDKRKDLGEVAKETLSAPVRQRVYAVMVGLVGAQVAVLVSTAFSPTLGGTTFSRTYGRVGFGVAVALFLGTTYALYRRYRRVWGHVSTVVPAEPLSAIRKAIVGEVLPGVVIILMVISLIIVTGVLVLSWRG